MGEQGKEVDGLSKWNKLLERLWLGSLCNTSILRAAQVLGAQLPFRGPNCSMPQFPH